MTHTPGPWRWDGAALLGATDTGMGFDDCILRTLGSCGPDNAVDESLIAAAPALLEALKAITHEWDKTQFRHPITDQARAAIAKAEGS